MTLPDVPFTIQDGGLGLVPTSTGRAVAKIGICSAGVPGQLYSAADIRTLQTQLGAGPLVEAGAVQLALGGGPAYFVPAVPSVAGAVGAVTHGGTGGGTVTPTLTPAVVIIARVSTGGALGTATIQFSVNGGAYGTAIATTAGPWSYLVPGTQTTLTFAAATYVATKTLTFNVDGTQTAASGWVGVVTQASSPLDAYPVLVVPTTAGAPGTGAFKYSLDGGTNFSPPIAVPGAGLYVIPGTGILLTFAGSLVVDDTYSFSTTAAGYGTSDVTTAMTALIGNSTEWGLVHIVGAPSSAALAVALAAVVDTNMATARSSFRFARALVESPTSEADATVAAAAASFASTEGRTFIAAGDFSCVSPITGRKTRRNIAWLAAGRFAAASEGHDLAAVADGPFGGICDALYRDEAATPLLDAARFVTARTYIGKQGYYLTNFRSMAVSGSDFSYGVLCRVIDKACKIARNALLIKLNSDVRVDKATGYIDKRDAQFVESYVNAQLKAGVVDTGDASSCTVQLSRTTNILSTEEEPVTVAIIPKGYLRRIPVTIGFSNPALAA